MKTVLAFVLMFATAPAFASQIGCATTISIDVSQMLHANPKTNEVVQEVIPQADYTNLATYLVISAPPANGQPGIPSKTTWLVVVRKGPLATCTVEQVLEDTHVE